MKKLFLLFTLVIFSLSYVSAQEKKEGNREDMFAKIKAEKISFFTDKLDLTPAEAQAFWPVYNEYEKKHFDLMRQIHSFEHMPDDKFAKLSDSEVEKLTEKYVQSFEQQAKLLREYNTQFLKILPNKKVLMLYRAENQFRAHLIREFKRGPKRE